MADPKALMEERLTLRRAFAQNPEMAEMLNGLMDTGKLKSAEDKDPTEPLMVICKRWPGLVGHSRMALCSFCGSEVALAPSSQDLVDEAEGDVKYCCMECFSAGEAEKYDKAQKGKEAAVAATQKS